MKQLDQLPNVEILFDHEVVGVTQTDTRVRVDVRGAGGVTTHEGLYLIGADGARSTVRKQTGISFDGFTWPERFLVLTTPFDFEAAIGCCPRSYFADPEEWCNCFKVSANGPPGLWRLVFPTNPESSDEELMSDARRTGATPELFPVVHAVQHRPPESLRDAPARGRHLPHGTRRRSRATPPMSTIRSAEWA